MKDNRTKKITIQKGDEVLEFNSMTSCAKYLNCYPCQVSVAARLGNKVRGWSIVSVELLDLESYNPKNARNITISNGIEELEFNSLGECEDFLNFKNLGWNIKKFRDFEKDGWKIIKVDGKDYISTPKPKFIPTRNNRKSVTIFNGTEFKEFDTFRNCSYFLNKHEDYITNIVQKNRDISNLGWTISEINGEKYFSKYYYKRKSQKI